MVCNVYINFIVGGGGGGGRNYEQNNNQTNNQFFNCWTEMSGKWYTCPGNCAPVLHLIHQTGLDTEPYEGGWSNVTEIL